MKIKDKLIHLLGGYTKAEYQLNKNTNVRIPVIRHEKPIRTYKIGHRFNPNYQMNEREIEYVKKDMAYMLADKLNDENMIQFTSNEQAEMYAIIQVIDPNDITL